MNPESKDPQSPTKQLQKEQETQQNIKIDLFLSTQNVLQRYHRAQMAYLNIIDLLSKQQQPQNDFQYRTCINYLQALAMSSINEGKVEKDFMKKVYEGDSINVKKLELLQYYKFHKNIGMVVHRPIEVIMGEYHKGKRKQEYKDIRKRLKIDYNIQIKSYKEDSSQSVVTPSRSQYSSLLGHVRQSQKSAQKSQKKSQSHHEQKDQSKEQKVVFKTQIKEVVDEPTAFSKMYQSLMLSQPSSLNIDKLTQKLRKKQFDEDLKLKNLLKKIKIVPKPFQKQSSPSRIKVIISNSRVLPKTLLKSQTSTLPQQTKIKNNSSILNKLVSMQSQMEINNSRFSSKINRRKTEKSQHKIVEFRSRNTPMNQSYKSLHRKKSDVFLPTPVPQIKCHLVQSQPSFCSSLSLHSKDKQGKNIKDLNMLTLNQSLKSRKHAQILFQKLKLHQ